jgi:group I intron endonuclease
MFTIGGLIKNHLVLLLKITICWELLTIILLELYFISVTMYNFEQSAGNCIYLSLVGIWVKKSTRAGTSETRRDPRNIFTRRYSPWNKNSFNLLYNNIYCKNIIRPYSTSNIKNEDNTEDLNPIMIYDDFKEKRADILKGEKDKSGVYCLINKINGHSYVGSSINLASRMKNYLNNAFLKNRQNINMPIVKALLKYGQSNFTLLILEHVDPESLIIRETYFITSIVPYYNVLKQGYSSLGYKHTKETKELLSQLAKNRVHSDLTKSLIAKALTGENNPFYNKNHSIESKVRMIEAKSAYPVYVYNSLKELLVIFPSVLTLAKLIKSNHSTIVDVIKEQNIFRGEWYFTNLPYNISDTPFITNWTVKESKDLILKINNNSHIRKAVFLYDKNKKFISRFEGVTDAQRALNISHCTIKKYAKLGAVYNDYIFSYERLKD